MSKKIKCEILQKKNLLHILTILLFSGALFTSFPFIRSGYEVDADLTGYYADNETKILEISTDNKLPFFHENTIFPKTEINVKKEPNIVLAVKEKSYNHDTSMTVVDVVHTTITGYSSTVDQTNSQPFITASGYWVRDGIVAANFLPFGTKIRVPEFFGDKVFVVKDRMNQRFNNRVDIWFSTRQEALNFGIRNTYIEIIKPDEIIKAY